MIILKWSTEVPDSTPDGGNNNKIAVSADGTVHVGIVSAVISPSDPPTLTYGMGKPNGAILTTGVYGPVFVQQYKWQFFGVLDDPSQWQRDFVFDLAVDSQGAAHFCFEVADQQEADENIGYIRHGVFNEATGHFESEVVDGPLSDIGGVSIAITEDDSLHIAYSEQSGLRCATRGAANPYGLTQVDSMMDTTFLGVSIAIGPAGEVGISYLVQPQLQASKTPGPLRLFYAQQTAAGWSLETVDLGPLNSGYNGLFGSVPNALVFDANGGPHIAYFDQGVGLQHATKAAAVWTSELIDTFAQPSPAKMLVDPSNALTVAYQGMAQNGTVLNFASRSSSGSWSTSIVDPTPTSGESVWAAFGPNGLPHIVYGYPQNGSTVVAHIFAVEQLVFLRPRPKKPIGPIHRIPQ